MTEETYNRISEIYHLLLQNEDEPLIQDFKNYSHQYWQLSVVLPKEQWQVINNCFCCFHRFHMAMISMAIEGTNSQESL